MSTDPQTEQRCICTGTSAGLNACTECPTPWPDIPGATRIRRETSQPAAPVAAPPTGQAGLREQVAAALYERERPPRDPHWPDVYASDREVFEGMADAVLPLLPTDTARLHDEILTLRADQAQMRDLLRTEKQRADSAIDRETTAEDAEEEHRLTLSTALGLGTSAPWDAIRERAAELHQAQQPVGAVETDALHGWYAAMDEDATPVAPSAATPNGTGGDVAACLNCRGSGLDPRYNGEYACPDCPSRLAAETPGPETQGGEPLVHIGWWCWRGDNQGHLATMACRSDNVPIHVPAEWEAEMRALIQRLEDGDEPEDSPPTPLLRSEDACPGFPERCPNLRPVDPNPPVHFGGIRCGCADTPPAVAAEPGKENDPHTVCICGHTRAEHLAVSGRLLCDSCDPDSTDNLVCKEFDAL